MVGTFLTLCFPLSGRATRLRVARHIWGLCGLGYMIDLLYAQAFGLVAPALQQELGFSGKVLVLATALLLNVRQILNTGTYSHRLTLGCVQA